jgi:hypothetical protein
LRYGLVCFLGALLALGLYPLWNLELRWFVVVVVALGMVSVALVFSRSLPDFLLVFLLFTIPFAGFTKWFFLEDFDTYVKSAAPLSGAVGLGLTDFILAGLYVLWILRIFVARTAPLPRLERIDGLVVLLMAAYVCSLWQDVPSRLLGISALVHLVKHALVYFYVSRNLRVGHLRWLLIAVTFAILLEAPLGLFQNRTGQLRGLVLDKGAGGEQLDFQDPVPGIENVTRATGTLYDSHALGLYLAMLLPYTAVLAFLGQVPGHNRLFSILIFALGLIGLVATFSRSGWISCAISLAIAWGILLKLGGRKVFLRAVPVLILLLLVAPWAIGVFILRFTSAPEDIMTARYDQYRIAFDIWSHYPLFGYGAGNYMMAMEPYPSDSAAVQSPVHNQSLFLGTELGLFGVFAFYAIMVLALVRLWKVIRVQQEPTSRIALAVFIGLVAYLLDGLTNPLFRESVVYLMFWLSVALSVALPRLQREQDERSYPTVRVRYA